MRRRRSARTRLVAVRAERAAVAEQLAVVDAQLVHVGDVASEAQTSAVVSATPFAARDHRLAASDERRVRRERDRLLVRLAELDQEQDRLLDLLLDHPPQERR